MAISHTGKPDQPATKTTGTTTQSRSVFKHRPTLEMFDAEGVYIGYLNLQPEFDSEAEAQTCAEVFVDAFSQLTEVSLGQLGWAKTKTGYRFHKSNNQTIGFCNNAKVDLTTYSGLNFDVTVHVTTPQSVDDWVNFLS